MLMRVCLPTAFIVKTIIIVNGKIYVYFFHLSFLSRTFTIHSTAGEVGGFLFNSSLSLSPASQTLRH